MTKTKSRLMSLFLSLVMVMSLVTVPVSAAPYDGTHTANVTATVLDAVTKEPIAGAKVQLEDITAGRYQTYEQKTTGSDGKVVWSNLSSGQYRATQISTDANYKLDTAAQSLWLDASVDTSLDYTFYNFEKGSLTIYRLDPATMNGVSGCKFVVLDSGNNVAAQGTTDANGRIYIPHLADGTYVVTEVDAGGHYNTSTQRTVKISASSENPAVVDFYGSAKSSITVICRDSSDYTGIPNTTWTIREVGAGAGMGTTYAIGPTNDAGMAMQEDLNPGTYVIEQTGWASGYMKKVASATFTISADAKNVVQTLYNTKLGSVTMVATDAQTGNPLPGVLFTLYNSENKVQAGPTATGSDGKVAFGDVPDGNYVAVAVAPTGYVMDMNSTAVTVVNGSHENVPFTATAEGSILISSYDAANSSKPVEGAQYKVYDGTGALVGTYVTGSNGTVQTSQLANGTYRVEQVSVPSGYVMVSTTNIVKVTSGKTTPTTFYNRSNPFVVVSTFIQGTNTPIPGSTVTLTNDMGVVVATGVTNADGTFTFENVTPGTYTANYSFAPNGFTIEVSSQTVNVTTSTAGKATLTASKHSAIVITAFDSQNANPLAGALYLVRDELGALVEIVTTGADGVATTQALTPGKYTISTYFAPEGYVPDATIRTTTVKNNVTTLETFTHTKKAAIVVYAYAKDGTPLANVPYIVYNAVTGQEVAHIMTNGSGVATTEILPAGNYMVTETTIPAGMNLVNPTQSHIVLNTGAASYVRFVHVPQSCIEMMTVDQATGAPIDGAVYQITTPNGEDIGTFTAAPGGSVSTSTLKSGTYYVKQVVAPAGYVLNTTTQTVYVKQNEILLAKFFNAKQSNIEIHSVVQGSSFGLEDCSYTVEDATGKVVYTGVTDATGVLTTPNLAAGKYTVKQIATTAGYTSVQSAKTVTVTTYESTTVKFENIPHTSIIIQLTDGADTAKGLANSVFQIEKQDGSFVCELTTGTDGVATSPVLEPGIYHVHQTSAPAGYKLDTSYKWAFVTKGYAAKLEFVNDAFTGLLIQALDQATHNGIAGAKFEIYHENGKLVTTVTSDSTGLIDVGVLPPDIYLIKQVGVPTGWTALTMSQKVVVTVNTPTTATFYHTNKSSLTVTLVDAKDASKVLPGAVYRITGPNGFDRMETTNANGQIQFNPVDAGVYTILEQTAPNGYKLDSTAKTVTVKDGMPAAITVTNSKLTSLTIECLTEKDRAPIAGGVFEVYNSNNVLVGSFTSTATGSMDVGQLEPGTYTIKEVKTPDHYTTRTTSQTAKITLEGNVTVTFLHTAHSSLTVKLMDVNTKAPLANGEFRVLAANGDLIGNFITDAAGQFVVPTLPAGKYTVSQIKAVDGYVFDGTAKTVIVKDNQEAYLEFFNSTISSLRIINTVKQTNAPIGGSTFKITKYDGTLVGNYTTDANGIINVTLEPGTYTVQQTYVTKQFVLNTTTWNVTIKGGVNSTLEVQNEVQSRIVVHVIDAETKNGVYNVEIEIKDQFNNLIGRYRTDNQGDIELTGILNAGKYKLTMLSVPAGYEKDTVPKTIVVQIGGLTELTWKITGSKGQVTIVTYAGEDSTMMQVRKNTKLAGATYTVTDMSGKVVATIVGDVNGYAHTGALPLGTYFIQQTAAPYGWMLNSTRLTVKVTSLNDDLNVEIYNKAAVYNMSITVHGQATAVAGGQLKYYFTDIKNASSTPMSNFFVHIKVPTDAMRAGTFYTGTYNYQTYYRLEYKTNLTDYRVLANGLNSKNQYNYDLNSYSLGLGVGEYVTDIRMVFPTVIAGFHESMAPTLYCNVLSTIYYGYQAIMRAEVGGMDTSASSSWTSGSGAYLGTAGVGVGGGSWSSGASSFTTFIYPLPQGVLPPKLPKTGY